MNKSVILLGYASGEGARDSGCAAGPDVLKNNHLESHLKQAVWDEIFYSQNSGSKLDKIADLAQRLAAKTKQLCEQQQFFTVLGGDHTSAIGTWSGVSAAIKSKGKLGLVWIDAHMDSHTPQTTESGNLHGMPLACLLGYGAPELTSIMHAQAKIAPEHLSLIGVRSFERGEAELIKRLNVRVYGMQEINERGLTVVLNEAIERAKHSTAGYGISLDIDAVDPQDAPGTGAAEKNGILGHELSAALIGKAQDEKLLGIEIVEFDPGRDQNGRTEKLIEDLLINLFK